MAYLIRSTNGLILSDEEQETIFQTEEAQKQIDFLKLHTTEEWKLISLSEDRSANQKG